MSKSSAFLLRVQSADGTKRVEIDAKESVKALYEKVHDVFNLSGYRFALYKSRGQKDELVSSRNKTLLNTGLRHGDIIYLHPINGAVLLSNDDAQPGTSTGGPLPKIRARSVSVPEDEVDLILWKQDGKIHRKRDNKLCRHGTNGACIHCSPLEPFDEGYLKEQNIKHLSFHAYLRKLTAGADRGKFLALENLSCKIKSGCLDHPPWPMGICSKCQPAAITLNRQVYRHTDNVMFENAHLVERFLNYWRSSGLQRLGFLYGRYEVHSDVPLGIRATVMAIYEPPQENSKDGIKILPDERENIVDELAKHLGLVRVGWIFTDLVADDIQKGTVKNVRNIESHFLSAQECITAGYFQNKFPNPCRFSPTGYFGSKFVTICVTGDSKQQVHMEGYQVSGQCMSLVRDGCLVPTKDAPELGYIPESTDKKLVPDVFYKEKDSYGNEVHKLARSLPVEYLLVDVPASTPLTPQYTFTADEGIRPFPVENRLIDGQVQDLAALGTYLSQFAPDQFLKAVSDFHLLLFIATMEILPMKEYMAPLLEAVKTQNASATIAWSQSDQWATVEQVIATSSASHAPKSLQPSGLASLLESRSNTLHAPHQTSWTCGRCTFLNPSNAFVCDMCSLPR